MIPLAAQIAEAQREVALWRQYEPAWIKRGKLDAGDAKPQILCMEEIVRTLMRLDAEQRQLSLCGTGAYGVRQEVRMKRCRARQHAALLSTPHEPLAP
jgi:hypothetical protein